MLLSTCLQAQEVWEYSPYKVRVWTSISPTLGLSEESKQEIYRKVLECSEIEFGATWNVDVLETPDALFGSVLYHLDDLTIEQLLSRELVLMLAKSDQAKDAFLAIQPKKVPEVDPSAPKKKLSAKEEADLKAKEDAEMRALSLNSVRTFDSAVERIPTIAIPSLQYNALNRDIVPFLVDKEIPRLREEIKPLLAREVELTKQLEAEAKVGGVTVQPNSDKEKKLSELKAKLKELQSEINRIQEPLKRKEREVENWNALKTKIVEYQGSLSQLKEDLDTGKYFAALIPKPDVPKVKEVSRTIPTRFPWQPEAMLRDKDKVMLVSVDREGERIRIQVKELDAFVRRIGLMETSYATSTNEIPNAIAYLSRACFTPMARIEENDNKTAILRVRASGLVTTPDSPIRIDIGDVLAPYVRRDDLTGNPTLLQNMAFTYIAVTEPIDEARYYGAIFAASRGALVAAKNRRTRRVALKIKPQFAKTDLKLGVRGSPASAVPGVEVYRRTPGSDDLNMVGRSDWRGIIDLKQSDLPEITYDQPTSSGLETIAKARFTTAAALKAKSAESSDTNPPSFAPKDEAAKAAAEQEALRKRMEKPPTSTLKIKLPLYLYYIKNGETLLARLPIITGYRESEKADLPDDRRRLQAEAFLKGIQGEILDLVVRRKILDARTRRKIDEGKLDEASSLLDELKKVRSYEGLSSQIQNIERRAESTENGLIPAPVKERINKMLSTTSDLVKNYLQEDIVRELEVKIADKKSGR
ncbi:MAG: hypothetical protein FJ308_00195 [Planctomycetes bacterium]|nr:hypothetical protein [Planctomycetota bacterium]